MPCSHLAITHRTLIWGVTPADRKGPASYRRRWTGYLQLIDLISAIGLDVSLPRLAYLSSFDT